MRTPTSACEAKYRLQTPGVGFLRVFNQPKRPIGPKAYIPGVYPSGLCRKWERDKRLRNNHLRESRRLLSQRPLALNLGRQRGGRTKAAVDNYPNRGSCIGSQVMG